MVNMEHCNPYCSIVDFPSLTVDVGAQSNVSNHIYLVFLFGCLLVFVASLSFMVDGLFVLFA